jgi:uncharacterized protein (TIGR02996 family)
MTEREALLRAVCANPDEDTPRLVFADWLEENGEEARAEFIRLQCASARLPAASSARQHKENRIRFLLQQYDASWRGNLPHDPSHRWGETFLRGFIHDITLLESIEVHALKRYLDATPVTSLTVNCWQVDWERLFADDYLQRLFDVTIDTAHLQPHVGSLCRIGIWPRLQRLVIAGTVTEAKQYVQLDSWTADSLRKVFGDRVRLPPRGEWRS